MPTPDDFIEAERMVDAEAVYYQDPARIYNAQEVIRQKAYEANNRFNAGTGSAAEAEKTASAVRRLESIIRDDPNSPESRGRR